MHLLSNQNIFDVLQNNYLILDSDFLGKLFDEPEFLEDFLLVSKASSILLDPFIAFEFLRDVFDPEIKKLKEVFLDSDFFNPATNHSDLFLKIQEQALILSKIYAHNNRSKGVGTIDLFLAARLLKSPVNTLIITGNKKDYPSCIFNIKAVLNIEDQNSESVRCFSVVELDREKLKKCYDNLLKIESKNK